MNMYKHSMKFKWCYKSGLWFDLIEGVFVY